MGKNAECCFHSGRNRYHRQCSPYCNSSQVRGNVGQFKIGQCFPVLFLEANQPTVHILDVSPILPSISGLLVSVIGSQHHFGTEGVEEI